MLSQGLFLDQALGVLLAVLSAPRAAVVLEILLSSAYKASGSIQRSQALPDVPTTEEAGIANSAYEFWVGNRRTPVNAARYYRPSLCRDR